MSCRVPVGGTEATSSPVSTSPEHSKTALSRMAHIIPYIMAIGYFAQSGVSMADLALVRLAQNVGRMPAGISGQPRAWLDFSSGIEDPAPGSPSFIMRMEDR
jgi:hypothetical protein